MSNLDGVALFILLPAVLGGVIALYLIRRLQIPTPRMEFVEFILLSVSVLVLIVDLGPFQEGSQLAQLREDRSETARSVDVLARSLQERVCIRAAEETQERIELFCGQLPSQSLHDMRRKLDCETMSRETSSPIRASCGEIGELRDRWNASARRNEFLGIIPSVDRMAEGYRAELRDIHRALIAFNEIQKRISTIESPEGKLGAAASDFLDKGFLTCFVAFGIGMGVARRLSKL